MKEILVVDVPYGATVLRAHDGDYDGHVPQSHIIEIFKHHGGVLQFKYDDFYNIFNRIRFAFFKQIEIKTREIPPNSEYCTRMVRDIL